MIAGIRKLTNRLFKGSAQDTGGSVPRKRTSAGKPLPTIFYSEVSPIYRFKVERSKMIRFRLF